MLGLVRQGTTEWRRMEKGAPSDVAVLGRAEAWKMHAASLIQCDRKSFGVTLSGAHLRRRFVALPSGVRRSQSVSRKSKSPYPRLQLWDGGEGQLGAFQQMAALSNNLCFPFFFCGRIPGKVAPQQTHSRPTILRGELCSTGRCARTFGFPTPRLDLSRQHAGPGRGEQWRQHFFGSSFVRRANLLQHAVSPRS